MVAVAVRDIDIPALIGERLAGSALGLCGWLRVATGGSDVRSVVGHGRAGDGHLVVVVLDVSSQNDTFISYRGKVGLTLQT